MTTGSRGDLAVHEWREAEDQRARAVTKENAQRDERLERLESAVEALRARDQYLHELIREILKRIA